MNIRKNAGIIKVMWFDRYYTYLNRPLSIVQFIIVVFIGYTVGLPVWMTIAMLVAVVAYTIIIAKFDKRVLAQEMEYYARINPYFQNLEQIVQNIEKHLEIVREMNEKK